MEGMQPKEQDKPTYSIYQEPQVISNGLSYVPGLQDMMIRYGLVWLTDSPRRYTLVLLREFYTSYTTVIYCSLSEVKKPLTQPRLTETHVRGRLVDISEQMIRRMLFYPQYHAPSSIAEFENMLGQAKNSLVMKDLVQQTSLLRWVVDQIVELGLEPARVTTYTKPIVKASLNFPTKFWWVIVRSYRLTLANNTLCGIGCQPLGWLRHLLGPSRSRVDT